MFKKILLGTVISLFLFNIVFAQSSTSSQNLLDLIKQLQAQVQILQAQIVKLQSKTEIPKTEFKFSRTLRKGNSGDDVRQLQEFLKTFPDIYPEAMITGYFGPLTEAAVIKFQKKYSIEPVGIVGPKTQTKIKEIFAFEIANNNPVAILSNNSTTSQEISQTSSTLSIPVSATSSSATSSVPITIYSGGGGGGGGGSVVTVNYLLTVSKSGTGSGTIVSTPSGINCGTTCSVSYTSGTIITLTATASANSTFSGWSDACAGSNPTCNITMNSAVSATATFIASGWTQAIAEASWAKRQTAGVLTFDNKMWLMGGSGDDGVPLNDVWYSTDGANWTEATASAQWPARQSPQVTVFDSKMWIMAGWNDSTLNDVWYSTSP